MPAVANKQSLKLNFKDDTMTTVSRDSLRAIAARLGFNETQTALYAIARLRDEVLVDKTVESPLTPLTVAQHVAISKAEPRGHGKVLDSLLP